MSRFADHRPGLIPVLSCRLAGWGACALFALAMLIADTASAGVLSDRDSAATRDAFVAYRTGNTSRAFDLAATAGDKLPLKLLHFLDYTRPGSGAKFEDLAAFIEQNPDWPQQAVLRQRAEEAISGVPDATLRDWFKKYKPTLPFAQLRDADIMAAGGDAAGAQARIREIWIGGDFGPIDERTVLARYGDSLRIEDHEKRLDRLLWDGQADAADRMLARVPPDIKALGIARLKLAAQAKNAESFVANVPPQLRNNPGLLFERMHWRRRNDMDDGALEILRHAPQDLVRPAAWWPDRQILARRELNIGNISQAYHLVAENGLSDGAPVAEAEFLAGWIALRFLREPDRGYRHFVRLYDTATMPLSLSRGAYWAGRAAAAMQETELAIGWYEKAAQYTTTYYGQLATSQLGLPWRPKPEHELKATVEELAAFNKRELVRAVRILALVNEPDRMKPFLNRLSELSKTPTEHAMIADLADDLVRLEMGVAAAKRASYQGITLLRAGYPIISLPEVSGGTEHPLLLAITRQESAFEVGVVSRAGARGLMQLMPTTANQVAKSLQLPFSPDRLTTDGLFNVTLGQAYLDGLLSRFNGSYVLAIAAYNAGPARVRQWLQDYGDPRQTDIDVVDWIEQIPFNETRNYVQRVLEGLQVYRLRIGNRELAFSLTADLRR